MSVYRDSISDVASAYDITFLMRPIAGEHEMFETRAIRARIESL